MRFSMAWRGMAFAVAVAVFSEAGNLGAQSVGGSLRGRVRDASGAVVAAASIRVQDTEKGLLYSTATDSLGLYAVALPPGSYQVEVSAPGFALTREKGIALSLGQTVALDFTLEVSGMRESVEVEAAAPLVDTSSGTLSGLVDHDRVQELPLNGRDFGLLTLLQPGVSPDFNGANAPFGGAWANFMINGQIDQATLFLWDGSEINDLGSGRTPSGSSGLLMGLEAVREFQVLLNNYKAEFGKNSGGVVSVATRSGTNQFHGTAFEFLRNSALDGKNFFDPVNQPIPAFRRNQFGASLGGPIHKDRTFFFLDYEGLRERKGITAVALVPTAAQRAGAVPAVVPFLNLYPLPNGGAAEPNNLTSDIVQPTREDFGLARVDHQLGQGTTLMARLDIQDGLVTSPFASTPVPGFPQDLPHRNTFTQIGATSAVGSNAVNEFHFAFNRTFGAIQLPPPPNGLTITPVSERAFGLITITGYSNLGTQTFVEQTALNLFETAENYSYRRGRHSQKYGVSIQRYQDNELRGTFFNGQDTFAGLPQFLAGTPASFIGVLGGTSATGAGSPAGWRWTGLNLYAQDDFQVRPNLTLNLGIRYEFSTSPSEVNGQIANLRSPTDPQITYGPLFNAIPHSIAPRFGFAWSPLASRRASLRGGFGIFYNPLVVNMYGNSRLVPPYVVTNSIPNPAFPNPLATGQTPGLSLTGQSIDYNLSQPYTEAWNLQWQQQFSSGWVATAGYVGNRTVHLIRALEGNSAIPTILPGGTVFYPLNDPRRNPNFGAIRNRSSDGNSWYDALQLTLQKRYARGLTFQASYTWSKSLGTNDSSFTTLPSQPTNTQNPDNPAADKGLTAFDMRQRLVANVLWKIPGFGGANSWNRLLNGWSMSAIGSVSSGLPFTVIDGFNQSRNLQNDSTDIADRPNLNAGRNNGNITQGASSGCPGFPAGTPLGTPTLYFDPCAFTLPAPGFYGNMGRNALIGPGFVSLDLSLIKGVVLREGQALEFRADFFNLSNRPNLATPGNATGAQISGGVIVFPNAAGVPSSTAGQIFRTVSSSREIQFSLRYRF